MILIFAVFISGKGGNETNNVEATGEIAPSGESVSGGVYYEVPVVSSGLNKVVFGLLSDETVFLNLKTAYEGEIDWLAKENPEDSVYTFLQGPRAYSTGVTWGGEWCMFSLRGNSFGSFGCGLCCMANIYDSMSPYEVDPLQMYEYAKVASNYSPTSKTGAIGWTDMWKTLKTCGIDVRLANKPETYEEFREDMKNSVSMVAVVSSTYSKEFWTDTSGHYINIWLYNEEDETVFLAEPGDPENNRTRIPLVYVYNALKLSSNYQYLRAVEYDEKKNEWKGDGMEAVWNSP